MTVLRMVNLPCGMVTILNGWQHWDTDSWYYSLEILSSHTEIWDCFVICNMEDCFKCTPITHAYYNLWCNSCSARWTSELDKLQLVIFQAHKNFNRSRMDFQVIGENVLMWLEKLMWCVRTWAIMLSNLHF